MEQVFPSESKGSRYALTESFKAMAKNYGFKHAGFFSFQGQYYFLTKAYGLDVDTIQFSRSSMDFWEGALTKAGKWCSYSREDREILQFYQFFTPAFRDEIENLHFIKFYDDELTYVFFVAELSDEVPLDLYDIDLFTLSNRILKTRTNTSFDADKINTGLKFHDAHLYKINIAKVINAHFEDSEIQDNLFWDDVYKTSFNEFYEYIQGFLGGRNIISSPEGDIIYACIFSEKALSPKLLFLQLVNHLSSIIDSSYFADEFIQYMESTQDASKIKTFLFGEN